MDETNRIKVNLSSTEDFELNVETPKQNTFY